MIAVRLLPIVLLVAAATAYVFYVEDHNAYPWRNALPMLVVLILATVTLRKGDGAWGGSGWRWPLGTLGFAIPALGLSMYLHYGYATDMNGMVSESIYPREVFRYLPAYTSVAGAIGFAIGWIAGRNA